MILYEGTLDCAHHCTYWEENSGVCNTFSYDQNTKKCKLAKLAFIEDPLPGEDFVSIMIDTAVIDTLEMRCRGGEHCCVRNDVKMCGEGDGDCNHDRDCDSGLICGDDNCSQQVSGERDGGGDDDHDKDCTKCNDQAQKSFQSLMNFILIGKTPKWFSAPHKNL